MANQVYLYSVDTSAFFTDEEMSIETKRRPVIARAALLKKVIRIEERFRDGGLTEKQRRKELKEAGFIEGAEEEIPDLNCLRREKQECDAKAKEIGTELKAMCQGFQGLRQLRSECICPRNIIGTRESELTRALCIQPGEETKALIVVEVFWHSVFEDLILDGFLYEGEHYIPYTASAGQTRKKKFVFIQERCWKQIQNRLMCGLTVDRINSLGTVGNPEKQVQGVNITKFLAYLALSSTTTEVWEDFDIDRSIVVEDFESCVFGCVDYIDVVGQGDDSVMLLPKRQNMDVPITHTDGCGMILSSKSKKNFMVRLPWIKGLLASFPFGKFIREANKRDQTRNHGIVTDIYGVEHDVLKENIEVIFTKSQFKMWEYYQSWEEYKQLYKMHGCSAGIGIKDPDNFTQAKLTYQVLQTLSELTDDELNVLCAPTVEVLEKLSHDRDTMLKALGATKYNDSLNEFQQALMIYPELLRDEYCRETLKKKRNKIRDEAYCGHLKTKASYTFLIPDLFAFCQRLFLKEDLPSGLLEAGEVYCSLFPDSQELDCLRSPHLYREHAVRNNLAAEKTERAKEISRWYKTEGLYTSSHDLISKLLQFDNDGDKSLVVAEPVFVKTAKRHMENIVPLYYKMGKAKPALITREAIFDSLCRAYKDGDIGTPTNELTALWNNPEIDLELIKMRSAEVNFRVDYAKTLFMPTLPEEVEAKIKQYNTKVPFFFKEAKKKDEEDISPQNNSTVNRIRNIIPNYKQDYTTRGAALGSFEWWKLASKKRVSGNEQTKQIIQFYKDQVKKLGRQAKTDDETGDGNMEYLGRLLRSELLKVCPDTNLVVDVLVKELFPGKRRGKTYNGTGNKRLFWNAFGAEVLDNLRKNIPAEEVLCVCGHRYIPTGTHTRWCEACSKQRRKESDRLRKREARKN